MSEEIERMLADLGDGMADEIVKPSGDDCMSYVARIGAEILYCDSMGNLDYEVAESEAEAEAHLASLIPAEDEDVNGLGQGWDRWPDPERSWPEWSEPPEEVNR